ncbi:MAG TPA: CoA-binding protein [Ktedonobacterales bacterium]|nr:CoA-binding protein [Ktedonobacterales bacterium]
MFEDVPDDEIRAVLTRFKRIAVVGLSENPARPSYGVAAYLLRQGYEIDPVNPTIAGRTVLGRTVYASLRDLPRPPEIVDVFRRSEFVPPVAEDAIAVGAKVLWTQYDVVNDVAAQRAADAGLIVIQDHCTAADHRRLGIGPVSGTHPPAPFSGREGGAEG